MRDIKKLFESVNAAKFFPLYAPSVNDWRRKIAGKNSRGNPLSFSDADIASIVRGLETLAFDIENL